MSVEISVKSITDEFDGKFSLLVFDSLDVEIRKIQGEKFKSEFTDTSFMVIPGFSSTHEAEDEDVIVDKRSLGREVMVALAVEEKTARISGGHKEQSERET